jgi:hypothetical protein
VAQPAAYLAFILEETAMRIIALAALVALSATACGKKDNETVDTSTMRGMDTTSHGAVVPTTDTVVKTTTTDTIQGQAKDTTKTATKTTTTKTSTKTKTATKRP